ncbi:adenylate/guanylate cyclase domain-containing protein [Mesorhizobium sp. BAC0120]|uniref:AAA family ATPase n=1 Tax=Mesorhizobium sp. BAC0120 TaxID=3090670 RepID=UPI00298D5DE5|nr:adenylate/guanylate cyclase domain-containing protein [Mesorhizobium sp. BAC0120]MDW6025073.1 adenylate/guanylate cyclase domain-containing protein [Mesorhizobium sp. BAC0120]
MTDLRSWLRSVGLEKYADVFRDHGITLEILPDLTGADIDLLELPTGPRLQLEVAIRKLGGPARTKPPVANSERRQLTVMFCDLVGSTPLSERLDPEELRELIEAYRKVGDEVVARYEGTFGRYVGDGLLVYFGWPAHEDDAERAVRAALEMVHAVKAIHADPPLEVHIGVATGPTVVGAESQFEAFGRTLNLAVRLQGLAGHDEVVISNDTRRLVGETFDLEDLGEHPLKGIEVPERAWRVNRIGDAASRFEASHGERLTPLVDRQNEIELLLNRRQLASKGNGKVVLLSGEPGIGKSRVLRELRMRLEAKNVRTLRFQCSPYHTNSALWPFVDNFEQALKFASEQTPESKLRRLENHIIEEYGRPRKHAQNDVRLIASILSIPCEGPYKPLTKTPQKQKDDTLRTLVELVAAAARKRPSVVLFEDLHWADHTTLELLDLLVDRVKSLKLLMVLTHRPEFQNRWASHDHVETVDLTNLTPAQSCEMVSTLAGNKKLPKKVVEKILTKTDGLPLFVEELTKSILESGQLTDTSDHNGYAGAFGGRRIPDTLQDWLMARLDRYMPAKKIAQIGAAIGREFSYELISVLAPPSMADLDDMLEHLTASGLVFRRGTVPQCTYSFKHALVQDAAYESLLKRERRQWHADIAHALTIDKKFSNIKDTEPEILARHYTEAGLFEQAAEYWRKAGRNAQGRWALEEAIAHFKKGLDAIGRLPASKLRDGLELECRVELSTVWEAYRGWPTPELEKALKPALPLAQAARQQKPEHLARTLWGLWVQQMSVGPVAESLKWAKQLLRAGQKTEHEELLLVGHMAMMVTNFWLGNPRVVKQHADEILRLYDRDRHAHIVKLMNHDPKTLAGIYLSQVLWILGYPKRAADIVRDRDDHARLINHPFDTAFALTLGAWVFHYRREPGKQDARKAEVQRLARDAGLPFISEVLAPFLSTGISLAQQGHYRKGIEDMQRGILAWEAAGAKTVTPYIRSRLGEALALSGDVDAGLAEVDAMLEQIDRPGWKERSHLPEILRLKGWMQERKGDLAGAQRSYRASIRWARKQEAKSWELRTATSLARLWQKQGKEKEAYDLLAPIYGWFEEGFDTKDLIEAKALLAELAASRGLR